MSGLKAFSYFNSNNLKCFPFWN